MPYCLNAHAQPRQLARMRHQYKTHAWLVQFKCAGTACDSYNPVAYGMRIMALHRQWGHDKPGSVSAHEKLWEC